MQNLTEHGYHGPEYATVFRMQPSPEMKFRGSHVDSRKSSTRPALSPLFGTRCHCISIWNLFIIGRTRDRLNFACKYAHNTNRVLQQLL